MSVADFVLVFWAMGACVALGFMLCAYASNRPFKHVEMLALAALFLLFSLLVLTALYIISEAGVADMLMVHFR